MDGMSVPMTDKQYYDEAGKLKPGPTLPLAQAYVPIQMFTTPMTPAESLNKGTIWSDLVRPWVREV